jgi:hypothetical protein
MNLHYSISYLDRVLNYFENYINISLDFKNIIDCNILYENFLDGTKNISENELNKIENEIKINIENDIENRLNFVKNILRNNLDNSKKYIKNNLENTKNNTNDNLNDFFNHIRYLFDNYIYTLRASLDNLKVNFKYYSIIDLDYELHDNLYKNFIKIVENDLDNFIDYFLDYSIDDTGNIKNDSSTNNTENK